MNSHVQLKFEHAKGILPHSFYQLKKIFYPACLFLLLMERKVFLTRIKFRVYDLIHSQKFVQNRFSVLYFLVCG